MFPNLIFTVTVKSELTGNTGSVAVKANIDHDRGLELEKFYEAVRECLAQIAGVKDGESEEGSRAS